MDDATGDAHCKPAVPRLRLRNSFVTKEMRYI
jgi:hypothetical protein